MATDTCEYFTVGPPSLFLIQTQTHTHKHTFMYLHSKMFKPHGRLLAQCSSESWWISIWLFSADFSLWVISICEQAHTHRISPTDWRPPGHNQSGPWVKIIVSSVWWWILMEESARQEEGLSWTWEKTHTATLHNALICLLNLPLELARHSAMTDVVTLSCPIQYGAFPWRYFKTTLAEGVHGRSCTSTDLMRRKTRSRLARSHLSKP